MRTFRPLTILAALAAVLLAAPAAMAGSRAGVASVDATWHVGASAGQFTDEAGPTGADGVDPHGHSTKKRISDVVALRTTTRALLIADHRVDRVAILVHDLYLPHDLHTCLVASLFVVLHRKEILGL